MSQRSLCRGICIDDLAGNVGIIPSSRMLRFAARVCFIDQDTLREILYINDRCVPQRRLQRLAMVPATVPLALFVVTRSATSLLIKAKDTGG